MINQLKFLLTIFLSSLVLFISDPRILLLMLFLIFFLLTFVPDKAMVLKRMIPLLFISFMIIMVNLFLNTSLKISTRVILGLTTSLKIILLSLTVFIYTCFTPLSQISAVFSFLPKTIQLVFTITLSFIPIIFQEVDKIYLIQKTRGYKTSWLNIYKNVIPIIIPLLHRALNRAQQLALVLYSKGYSD